MHSICIVKHNNTVAQNRMDVENLPDRKIESWKKTSVEERCSSEL